MCVYSRVCMCERTGYNDAWVVSSLVFFFQILIQLLQLLIVLVEKAAWRRIYHRLGVPHLPTLSHFARAALELAANAERRGGSSVGGA